MFHSLSFIDAKYIDNSSTIYTPEEIKKETSRNTWESWHIVPVSKPVIVPATQKKQTIDIPGGDGTIDVSLALTGYPLYNNREGSIEFAVLNDNNYEISSLVPGKLNLKSGSKLYSELQDYLNGRELLCSLEDEPEYYYRGYWNVESWVNNEMGSNVTLHYSLEPYKFLYGSTTGQWLWDPFSFVDGIIYDKLWKDLAVTNDEITYVFKKPALGSRPTSPQLNVVIGENSEGISCVFKNLRLGTTVTTIFTKTGIYETPNMIIWGDAVEFTFKNIKSGNPSTVSIDFIPGVL